MRKDHSFSIFDFPPANSSSPSKSPGQPATLLLGSNGADLLLGANGTALLPGQCAALLLGQSAEKSATSAQPPAACQPPACQPPARPPPLASSCSWCPASASRGPAWVFTICFFCTAPRCAFCICSCEGASAARLSAKQEKKRRWAEVQEVAHREFSSAPTRSAAHRGVVVAPHR